MARGLEPDGLVLKPHGSNALNDDMCLSISGVVIAMISDVVNSLILCRSVNARYPAVCCRILICKHVLLA